MGSFGGLNRRTKRTGITEHARKRLVSCTNITKKRIAGAKKS